MAQWEYKVIDDGDPWYGIYSSEDELVQELNYDFFWCRTVGRTTKKGLGTMF